MDFSKGMSPYQVNGEHIPWSRLLELEDSSSYLQDSDSLRKNFRKEGYLFFRDFIPEQFCKWGEVCPKKMGLAKKQEFQSKTASTL